MDSTKPKLEKNRITQFAIEFTVSGVAAVISKTLASPIEVVKMRLQLQAPLLQKKLIEKPYSGMIDCFKRLYQQQGWRAYFKGNLINVIRYFPSQALNFAFKDFFMTAFKFNSPSNQTKRTFTSTVFNNLRAGSMAGMTTQFFVYPLDYVRTRLTNDIHQGKKGETRQFNGFFDCIKKTYESDGIRGLYRGFVVTGLFVLIYRGMYFGLNAGVKEQIPHEYLKNILISFMASYGVTVVSGAVAYPLDTIKRRMMMSSGEKITFNSSIQCASHMYRQNGLRSFVGGLGVNILRSIAGAGVLTLYDFMQLLIFDKKYKTNQG